MPPPVEFRRAGKGDMIDIQVQPHADGIRRHQVIHVTVLIKCHLRVPRPRAQRAHHHRRAALLPPDQLRQRIDAVDGKRDDRRAWRHPADLAAAGIGKLRKPLAHHELRLGHQAGNAPPHGGSTQKQGLAQAARVKQPVRKDMPPVGVPAQLDLVHRQEFGPDPHRHRLDGADPIGRPRRHDPLLSRHQRHHRRAAHLHNPVINLACKQPQRQADHACAVAQHPLDRIAGLAGIGRPKDRDHPRIGRHAHRSRIREWRGRAGGSAGRWRHGSSRDAG